LEACITTVKSRAADIEGKKVNLWTLKVKS